MQYQYFIRQLYFCPWYGKYLGGLVVILITGGLSVVFLLLPPQQQLRQALLQQLELKQLYQSRYQQYTNLQQLKLRQDHIEQFIAQRLPSLAHQTSSAAIMAQLVQSMKVSHLRLITIKPEIVESRDGLYKQSFLLTFAGTDQYFIRWLWLIAEQPWLWQVKQCELQKNADGIAINLELDIYHG